MSSFSFFYQSLLKRNVHNPYAYAKLLSSLPEVENDLFEKIDRGVPIDYIIGFVDFYGVKIEIDQNVLIPRQETELLVDLVVKELKRKEQKNVRILDVCTGSGCIAIALKKKFPHIEVFAVDIQDSALMVAKKNAQINGVEISFIQSDLFENIQLKEFDIIVSNPPYISYEEYLTLDGSVKDYEPPIALTDFSDGLQFYKKFSKVIKNFLKPGGKAFFEIGYNQKEMIKEIFENDSWENGQFLKDYAGHDRFFSLENAQ